MSNKETGVELSAVHFAYGNHHIATGLNFFLHSGERIAVMGPSGCGKSTLLRLIAGLEKPDQGEISLHGTYADAGKTRLLFQNYDTYPWLTASENIRVGSGPFPYPDEQTVRDMLESVGLTNVAHRFPAELSGGMNKRLALARVLIRGPMLLLMDEPFSSLDIDTKYEMYNLVRKLWDKLGTGVILVTHDPYEAAALCDKVIIFSRNGLTIDQTIKIPVNQHEKWQVTEQIVDAICNAQEKCNIQKGRN